MSGRDWQAFDAELGARAPEIVEDLLGKPVARAGQEWRWGRKGSLAVVIAGPKAGMWFDHEAGEGGGLVDLVGRLRGLHRREALDWTVDRIGMADAIGRRQRTLRPVSRPATVTVDKPRRRPYLQNPVMPTAVSQSRKRQTPPPRLLHVPPAYGPRRSQRRKIIPI